MDVKYRVETVGYGLDYCGGDEEAADAAFYRMVEYIDNDTCGEPLRVVYSVDGIVIASHESITWAGYKAGLAGNKATW